MKRYLISLFVALVAVMAVQAQAPSPVRWRATASMTSARAGVITLRALVDEGWHFWAMNQAEEGPIGLTITYTDMQGIRTQGAVKTSVKAREAEDKTFGCRVSYYDGNVTFTQPFKIEGRGTDRSVKVTVRYQTCKDDACMPPKTQTFNLRIPAYTKK